MLCFLTLFILHSLGLSFRSYLPYITLLLFVGLLLNAVYFSPYITSIIIAIFYSWTFWQKVETKYSTLKMQIYEVCKESGLTVCPNDGGCDDEDDDDDGGGCDDEDDGGGCDDEGDGGGCDDEGDGGGCDDEGDGGGCDDEGDGGGCDDEDDDDDGGGCDDEHDDGGCDDEGDGGGCDDEHDDGGCDDEHDDGGCDDEDDGGGCGDEIGNWEYRNNQPMILRQYYDTIREEILPYNLVLFPFFIKVLFVYLFAYFLFTIVNVLNTTDVSGTVKVITTMSMSVLPYIFNVVAAKKSEGEEKAEKEVQKIKVEKRVSELTDQVYLIYVEMSDDEI